MRSACESSEQSLHHKAELRVGRPILSPTLAAGKREGKVFSEAGALGHFTGMCSLPRPAALKGWSGFQEYPGMCTRGVKAEFSLPLSRQGTQTLQAKA